MFISSLKSFIIGAVQPFKTKWLLCLLLASIISARRANLDLNFQSNWAVYKVGERVGEGSHGHTVPAQALTLLIRALRLEIIGPEDNQKNDLSPAPLRVALLWLVLKISRCHDTKDDTSPLVRYAVISCVSRLRLNKQDTFKEIRLFFYVLRFAICRR